jgi:hypothetical protein
MNQINCSDYQRVIQYRDIIFIRSTVAVDGILSGFGVGEKWPQYVALNRLCGTYDHVAYYVLR